MVFFDTIEWVMLTALLKFDGSPQTVYVECGGHDGYRHLCVPLGLTLAGRRREELASLVRRRPFVKAKHTSLHRSTTIVGIWLES